MTNQSKSTKVPAPRIPARGKHTMRAANACTAAELRNMRFALEDFRVSM